jgi:hypothetical protein
MSNKIHYVYLTTNLISGKQYVGDHTIDPKEKRYYIGSGSYFCNTVKIYGEHNFFKEILEWGDTREEVSKLQEKYIKEFNTLKPRGYNISPTGGVGVQGCHSEETKNQIRNSCIGKTSSKKYTLIDPAGKEYKNVCLSAICEEKNLNFYTLRKHINYGKIQIKKTYHIKENTLNCESWQVLREGKHGRRMKSLWLIIDPNNKEFNLYKDELKKFIEINNLDWRILNRWKNKGKIEIKNKSQCYKNTLNTEGWEFKNYTKWSNK